MFKPSTLAQRNKPMNDKIMPSQKPPYSHSYGTHKRVQLECNDPSRTKQAFQSECDINNIMAKFQKTGLISHNAKHQGDYSTLPESLDYHDSLIAIQAAQDSFNSLPSGIRSKFDNDPEKFLNFVEDHNNQDEMIELGLATRSPLGDNQKPKEASADPGSPGPEDIPSQGTENSENPPSTV